ncbi:SRPBCC family protein [Ideonella sp. DXS29W]|uniref:SRPBCC family protein n=1 Tax=Ideonella lacteola TaxID=2984193 RepID=A0ABU9BUC8_9BURK
MLKKVGLALLFALAALLVFAATRPDTFRVERRMLIQAPPERVYGLVNDFHQWPLWSPWEKLDPAMKRTLGGPTSGVGATYAWQGNKDVGSGRMEIKASESPSKIHIQLDFFDPFESHNLTDFAFTPQGPATEVTWVMHGPASFTTKLMTVFTSMDSMVGPDFERGLANMKAVAEKAP